MSRFIIAIVLLITAVAVFFMLTKPLFSEIGELTAKRDSFDSALADMRRLQETRDQLLSQYNAIPHENIERLDKILPSQPGAIKFILEIENITQKNGMILKKIDIKERGETEKKADFGTVVKLWDTVPFSVKLSGSYKSFYSFVKDMEKDLRLTDINSIDFSSDKTDFYEFVVDGSFYWKKGEIPQNKETLVVLSLLEKINLNLDFFKSAVFNSLYDFSVKLPVSEKGKSNPFAP